MSSKGLLSSAAQYTIQYRPTVTHYRSCPRHRNRSPVPERERGLTWYEAINDEETWDTYQRERHQMSSSPEPGVPLTGPSQDENEAARTQHQSQNPDEVCDPATPNRDPSDDYEESTRPATHTEPSPRDFRAPTPPPPPQIRVTTDSNDANFSDVEEESTPNDILADRLSRETRWRSSAFTEDLDGAPPAAFASAANPGASSGGNTLSDYELLPPLERMWPDGGASGQTRWPRRHPP
ncbi:MAG: hypothetical protein INR71_02515, partial [Terriglobus roseus]|nr:hypothetical protein [Terriglobus roseus]